MVTAQQIVKIGTRLAAMMVMTRGWEIAVQMIASAIGAAKPSISGQIVFGGGQ
jgi:hypothetical protein